MSDDAKRRRGRKPYLHAAAPFEPGDEVVGDYSRTRLLKMESVQSSMPSRWVTRTGKLQPQRMVRIRRGRARDSAHARLMIAATVVRRGRSRQWLREIAREIGGQGWPNLKFNERIEADGADARSQNGP